MTWRRFFRRRQADAELAQEMNVHLAEETDENIARGMPADEARGRARLKFGIPNRYAEISGGKILSL